MTPTQVLDKHVDLIDRLQDTRFQNMMAECFKLAWFYDRELSISESTGRHLADKFGQGVRGAGNFYVTKDMQHLLMHAADSLDEEDFLDVSLPPTSSGFVVFEDAIRIIDVQGKILKAHYLTWTPLEGEGQHGLLLTWWADAKDPDDGEFEASLIDDLIPRQGIIQQICGDWRWIGADAWHTGKRLGPKVIPVSDAIADYVAENAPAGAVAAEGTNLNRIAHALWLLLEQTITVVREETVDRATARRAKKKNLPAGVTVIQLRRAEYVGGKVKGEVSVEWSHRWIVRGHWRWQHCGPNHKLAQETSPGVFHARIWIAPFVKGPEGAELIVTEKINVLNR